VKKTKKILLLEKIYQTVQENGFSQIWGNIPAILQTLGSVC
jgi:hypothetical protein